MHDAKPVAISSTFASVKLFTRAAHAVDAHLPVPGDRSAREPHAESKSRAANAPAHVSSGGGGGGEVCPSVGTAKRIGRTQIVRAGLMALLRQRNGGASFGDFGGSELEFLARLSAHFRRAVRARRGDDVDAERCLRCGRDQALLRRVLGLHVADFSFLPIRETGRPPTPKNTVFGSSSPTRRRCVILACQRHGHGPVGSPKTPRRAHSTTPTRVLRPFSPPKTNAKLLPVRASGERLAPSSPSCNGALAQ